MSPCILLVCCLSGLMMENKSKICIICFKENHINIQHRRVIRINNYIMLRTIL
ncbi:hypothetical protein HMPREF9539_05030 [Escherichia coli MS 110-3]|nr:hypothetical protein HMPREF9539_05030 [Escherichia coli MS 110-3]